MPRFARRGFLGLLLASFPGVTVASEAAGRPFALSSGVSPALRELLQVDQDMRSSGEPLRIRNANTGEEVLAPVIRMDRDGLAWNPDAFSHLDWVFRDWRDNIVMRIDRRIYVFLYLLQTMSERVHAIRSHVELTSGFRTERTNRMLRGIHGETVALDSFHLRGEAVDFRVAGLSTRICATLAWTLALGGVGLYGDRFVHCDTGPRRRWGDPFPT